MDIRYITVIDDGWMFYDYSRHFLCYKKNNKRTRVIPLPSWTWNVRFAIKKDNRIYLPYARGLSFHEILWTDEKYVTRHDFFADKNNSTISGYDHHLLKEDFIWCFPENFYDRFFLFDIKDNTFTEFTEWNRFVEENDLGSFRSPNWSVNDSDCFMPLYGKNKIIHLDVNNRVFEMKTVNPGSVQISAGCYDGKYLWLLTDHGEELLCCDKDCRIQNKISIGINREDFFGKICDCNDVLVLLPRYGDEILYFEKRTYHFSCMKLREDYDIISERIQWSKIISCARLGNQIMFPGNAMETLFTTDLSGSQYCKITELYDEGTDLYLEKYKNSKVVTESESGSLKAFLLMINE